MNCELRISDFVFWFWALDKSFTQRRKGAKAQRLSSCGFAPLWLGVNPLFAARAAL
jgi:hypothetical protein